LSIDTHLTAACRYTEKESPGSFESGVSIDRDGSNALSALTLRMDHTGPKRSQANR
jgi:hypothetical protein